MICLFSKRKYYTTLEYTICTIRYLEWWSPKIVGSIRVTIKDHSTKTTVWCQVLRSKIPLADSEADQQNSKDQFDKQGAVLRDEPGTQIESPKQSTRTGFYISLVSVVGARHHPVLLHIAHAPRPSLRRWDARTLYNTAHNCIRSIYQHFLLSIICQQASTAQHKQ